MKIPNENLVHGIGITLLILINITGNPIPAETSLASGLLAWLTLAAIIAAQWTGIVWCVRWSWRRFPELSQVKQRLILSFLSSILWATPLMVAADFTLMVFMENGTYDFTGKQVVYYLSNAFIFCFTGIGVTEAIYYYARLRESEKEKEELQRINLLTQYDSLKQQVSPHFLFNSLNSLSSLIAIEPKKAEKFVEELSFVYRYLLQNNQEELAPLRRELDFIHSYFHLLKTRFGNALQVNIEVPPAFYNHKIPPLTLQLLVENAVKHNEISTENPLAISISIEKDHRLRIANNLQRRLVAVPSEKVGLANIMAKYRLLGQSDVEVQETEGAFIVSLPLIKSV
jgi:sensor histidine kinase YesM